MTRHPNPTIVPSPFFSSLRVRRPTGCRGARGRPGRSSRREYRRRALSLSISLSLSLFFFPFPFSFSISARPATGCPPSHASYLPCPAVRALLCAHAFAAPRRTGPRTTPRPAACSRIARARHALHARASTRTTRTRRSPTRLVA